jgi:Phosphate-selective porin O and P
MLLAYLLIFIIPVQSTFANPLEKKLSSSKMTPYPVLNFGKGGNLAIRGYGALGVWSFPQTDKDSGEKSWHTNMAFSSAKLSLRYTTESKLSARFDAELGSDRLEAQELWFQYDIWSRLSIRGGRLRTPFGLAQTEDFLSRRFPSTPLIAGNSKDFRDIGFMLFSKNQWINVYVALVTGSRDVAPKSNETPDIVGRIQVFPFGHMKTNGSMSTVLKNLHFGGSASWGKGPSRNGFRGRTSGGFTYANPVNIRGEHLRVAAEFGWHNRWFYLRGEYQYDKMNRDGLISAFDYEPYVVKGYYLEAGVHLTGNKNSNKSQGGLELLSRFERIFHGDGQGNITIDGVVYDKAPVDEQQVTSLSLGVNWYISLQLRFTLLWQGIWFSDPRKSPDWVLPDSWSSQDNPPDDWIAKTHGPVHHFMINGQFQF